MGTTLTGTTPQDTYDSLIKVTDNGPISGTAKYLSDGLGNDSVLALSTSRVGIGTTSLQAQLHIDGTTSESSFIMERDTVGANAVIGQIKFTNNNGTTTYGTLLGGRNAAGDGYSALGTGVGTNLYAVEGGNVGIGTSSPDTPLTIQSAAANAKGLKLIGRAADNISILAFNNNANSSEYGYVAGIPTEFRINSGSGLPITFTNVDTERVRILAAGGLTFNGDTAQANALDDYEEGTFSPTLASGFSSAPSGYSQQSGKYTKIGDVVYFLVDLDPDGATADASAVEIGGLPFAATSGSPAGGGYITYQTGFNTNASDSAHVGTSGTTILFADSSGNGRAGNAAGVNINQRVLIAGFYKV